MRMNELFRDVSSETLIFTFFPGEGGGSCQEKNIFDSFAFRGLKPQSAIRSGGVLPLELQNTRPCDIEGMSIFELDVLRCGNPVFFMWRITGFKCKPTSAIAEATHSWTNVQQSFVDLGTQPAPKSTMNYFLLYETTEPLAYIFNSIKNDYFKNEDSLICAGEVAPGTVLVMVRKILQKAPPSAKIATPTGTVLEPRYFTMKRGGRAEVL